MDGSTRWRIYSSGDGGDALTVADADESAGVVLAQNSYAWASLSDERAKAEWRSFGDGLAKLRTLDKVGTYSRVVAATQKALSGSRHVGLSAQEVRKVLPEAVVEGGDGLLSLKYQDVFVLGLRATVRLRDALARAPISALLHEEARRAGEEEEEK